MKTVGLRELKNRLAACIRDVKAGEIVVVTDRGQVVAELRPPAPERGGARVDEALARLANRGLAILGGTNTPRVYSALPPLLRSTTSRELLDAERGRR